MTFVVSWEKRLMEPDCIWSSPIRWQSPTKQNRNGDGRDATKKRENFIHTCCCCLLFSAWINRTLFMGEGPHMPPTWTICNLFLPYLVLDEWGGSPHLSLSLSSYLASISYSSISFPKKGSPSVSRVFDVIFSIRRSISDSTTATDKGDKTDNNNSPRLHS